MAEKAHNEIVQVKEGLGLEAKELPDILPQVAHAQPLGFEKCETCDKEFPDD